MQLTQAAGGGAQRAASEARSEAEPSGVPEGPAERRRAKLGEANLAALTAGALALPGLAGPAAAAEGMLDRIGADYNFSRYSEGKISASKVAPGSERRRFDIDMHQVRLATPIADRFELGLDIVHESMSGATPWYVIPGDEGEPVQVMTGATVEDKRTDALLEGKYYMDRAQASLSGGVSFEKDYLAINGGLGGQLDLNEKLTTLSGGLGVSIDSIDPVDTAEYPLRPSHEKKQTYSGYAGISHVLGRNTALQSTLTYQLGHGFLSDPYKQALVEGEPLADSRPDMRHQIAWLSRLRRHFSSLNASAHLDYQFYWDDWSITAHSLEAAWYQTLFEAFRVIPSFRYYSQGKADFYANYYETPRADGLYSSDYRLSPYGALSWRIRAETRFSTWQLDWLLSFAYEQYFSSGKYALQKVSAANPGLVNYDLFSVGLTTRF
jgi:hypothetical protein